MITESQRIELVKKIRALEREYFPDYPEQILGTKAVEGLINYGLAQNTLFKEGWLEKQVRAKCENHIKNIAHKASDKPTKKLAAKIEAEHKAAKRSFDPPRRLRALDCRHKIIFTFGLMPDYQEQEKFYRVAFLALGFEFEAHIDKQTWTKFISQTKQGRKWEATITGQIGEENARGFLLADARFEIKYKRQGAETAESTASV